MTERERSTVTLPPAAGTSERAGGAPAPGSPRLNLTEVAIDVALLALIPRRMAETHQLIPLARQNGTLTVAMPNPDDVHALDAARHLTGLRIRPARVTAEEFQRALVRFYAAEGAPRAAAADEGEGQLGIDSTVVIGGPAAETAPAIRLLNSLLEEAIAQRASDIHVQPQERSTIVRFRIDGVMYNFTTLRPDQHPPLIS